MIRSSELIALWRPDFCAQCTGHNANASKIAQRRAITYPNCLVSTKNSLDLCSIYVPFGQMGFDKAALTFKALLVVHEAAEQTSKDTIKMTVGLRFALAYLFATGQSKDAAQIENFGNYMRSMQARGCQGAIIRNAGIEASPENESKLRNAFDRLAWRHIS